MRAPVALVLLALVGPATAPTIASLTPASAAGSTLTLTIEGSGFDATSSVPEVYGPDGRVQAAGSVTARTPTRIVATVESVGPDVSGLRVGDRVGVPWLGWTDGTCRYCLSGRENLCDDARFTGYHVDGGYAELAVADARFCFPIPAGTPDLQAAPLLCAGLIGFRALRMAGDGRALGFYGFGSTAHILTQVARAEGREVFAFTRPGDERSQAFARELGATWAGSTADPPPAALDAAIIFAPAGELVPQALRAVRKGGTVVCAGIHMTTSRPSRTRSSGKKASCARWPT
jgi:D-arabinose 1-dehydrogenase-like Zn-dependent alcohol dehydrogenase